MSNAVRPTDGAFWRSEVVLIVYGSSGLGTALLRIGSSPGMPHGGSHTFGSNRAATPCLRCIGKTAGMMQLTT